jgi:hypothetical protein
MLDFQSATALVFSSFIVGIITAVLPSGIGKLIALFSAFPLVSFLIISAYVGTTVTGVSDSVTLINWFVLNVIPLLIAYGCEGAGVGVVEGFRRKH